MLAPPAILVSREMRWRGVGPSDKVLAVPYDLREKFGIVLRGIVRLLDLAKGLRERFGDERTSELAKVRRLVSLAHVCFRQ